MQNLAPSSDGWRQRWHAAPPPTVPWRAPLPLGAPGVNALGKPESRASRSKKRLFTYRMRCRSVGLAARRGTARSSSPCGWISSFLLVRYVLWPVTRRNSLLQDLMVKSEKRIDYQFDHQFI